ncbi:MAG: hypothetical protein ACI4GY_06990 [Acutalibacteraceae bacterium]
MTNEKYDKLLIGALCLYKEQQLEAIPSEDQIDYEFSQSFQKKIKKLIIKQENPVWQFFKSSGRKAAAIILAIIIGFTATLSIDAVRKPIFEFFYRVFSTHTDVSFGENSDNVITEFYTLPSVPAGYKPKGEPFFSENTSDIYWENSSNGLIYLSQFTDNASPTFDSEGAQTIEISVNGIGTLFIKNSYSIICTWSEHGNNFILSYPLQLGEEFMYETIGKLIEFEN